MNKNEIKAMKEKKDMHGSVQRAGGRCEPDRGHIV
jgi:hypothetical protein